MKSLSLKLLLPAAAILLAMSYAPVAADEKSFIDEIKDMDIFKIRDGAYACPLPVVGKECPESNALYLFKCCGDLNSSCCFRLQDWAVAIIGIFVILIIAGIFVNLIRCIFCF
ncbi:protein SUP-1 [Ditylenchus destructor]|uniref:Protein SUP-1 n=1 Tax=Ditylenchus destructor TaxID=166010 RepID=A0AAD4N7B5_9BILA|nr:protein SUP-1 [Ditylenchus destructor]